MLKLSNITKEYPTGDQNVVALKGVSVEFRKNEFVSILGHSGCGKTTLLNIIGGLDHYTSGDLIIKGKSTKDFKDSDWDSYRNHSIGFVFQSYNLIPHQTVLANVELALTLSGVSKAERKQRATEALKKVGLGDQINKKPNQLSGGQMQRVAIARALVNNPEILLADEPTGALDSETSVQIMDILKEVAEDRLVIMVTHNPDLAEQYSTRIVKLSDGLIIGDSNPYDSSADKSEEDNSMKGEKTKKTGMSFFTALSLSLNNLMTKKMRTVLTSFAGSIGIIGIALIMALSNGVQVYIQSLQTEALSSYPLTIESQGMDMESAASVLGTGSSGDYTVSHDLDKVYSNSAMEALVNSFSAGYKQNNLTKLKAFLDSEESGVQEYVTDIQYSYSAPLNIYAASTENGPNQVNPSPLLSMVQGLMGSSTAGGLLSSLSSESSMETIASYYNMWKQLIDNEELLESQYDVIYGRYPEKFNEVVLVVDKNNEITGLTLQALGLSDPSEVINMFMTMSSGESYTAESVELTYEEILDLKFKVVLTPDLYEYDEESESYINMSEDDEYVSSLIEDGIDINIVGILRPAEGSVATMTGGTIGYLKSLSEYIITETAKNELVKKQIANPDTDVFTGLPFPTEETEASEEKDDVIDNAKTTDTDTFVKPVVSDLDFDAETPETKFIDSPLDALNSLPDATEEEIYAAIDKNYSGDEATMYKRTVELMLKTTRSIAERKELIGYLDKLLAGQEIEGMGQIDGETALTYLNLMDKTTKLKMLNGIITGAFGTYTPSSDTPAETPENNTATENETGSETPAAEVIPEPEPEPEPEPLASDYDEALSLLGYSEIATPLSINIYAKDFESKDAVTDILDAYNQKAEDEGREEDKIIYTDYIGLILSSVTKIVNIVSYVLMAFVAISLVVSSIMIGVITNISVLERTKEIGILRAIGASKHDISRVFNAETFIIGLFSGALGIGLTVLLIIPINLLLKYLTTLGAAAILPVNGAIILIVISMLLTVISGLIPSKSAANKDPVVALRTE